MADAITFYSWARELGFAQAGLCPPEDFSFAQQMVEAQEPLRERKQLRFCPQEDYPKCKSIAVLLWPYLPAEDVHDENVFIDSYYAASNAAYHAARRLEEKLLAAGCFAKANVSYPAKDSAIRAGMGVIGKNSLLITPAYGSRIVIILMATDIEPLHVRPAQNTQRESLCLNCGRCAQACPGGAIDEAGMSYPERCLRNYIAEGVIVPEHLRKRIGMRMMGCDICQRVCPMQPQFVCNADRHAYSLGDFMTSGQEDFSAIVRKLAEDIGRNAARPQRIRAQAALLAGNSKNAAYLPILRQWAQSPYEAVREHALWAIRQIESANT